ncbi:MAG: hypothetical protein H7222_10695 [Methylotenera sp.]|nr:hypothetical protein [Oligoflexia bacterium]
MVDGQHRKSITIDGGKTAQKVTTIFEADTAIATRVLTETPIPPKLRRATAVSPHPAGFLFLSAIPIDRAYVMRNTD